MNIGHDLLVTKIERRKVGGVWICGTVAGHRFSVLVFEEHAINADWELSTSRIAKLSLNRIANDQTVFIWDRGCDMTAIDDSARQVVEFLMAYSHKAAFHSTPATLEVTAEIWPALYRILNYLWGDEYRDYCSRKPAERHGHIFESLRQVKHWLEDVPQTAIVDGP